MKIVSFEDIVSLDIKPEQCYNWAIKMIKNKKDTILPPKTSLKPFDGAFCNVMPSIICEDDCNMRGGVKIVTRYPGRVPSLESEIVLFNANNGQVIALMDGTWITAMRTGAIAAHSILTFAKDDFSVIGIMGLGNTTRATLSVLLSQIEGKRHLKIKLLKHKNQEKDFVLRFSDYKNIDFSFVETPDRMIKGSDVILSGATYLSDDICEDNCFDEGVLVVPIHTRGFTNCDLFFDKVFADDEQHVCGFKHFSQFRQFGEVCDVVNGYTRGRTNSSERILVYNIGLSIHDIYFASQVYKTLKEKGIWESLPSVDLKVPKKKFWV